MSSFHFLPLVSIQSHSAGLYVLYKKGTYPNFWQRPMSHIAQTNTPWCCLAADIEEKQTKLETENK